MACSQDVAGTAALPVSATAPGSTLQTAGSALMGGGRPRSSLATRDAAIAKVEQETEEFLSMLQKRGYRYRSPFSTEDDDVL